MRLSNLLDTLQEHFIEDLNFETSTILRDDLYARFVPHVEGSLTDEFGRAGYYRPRGVCVYLNEAEDRVYKVFGKDFCENGEGRFLSAGVRAGLYDDLCSMFVGWIKDQDGDLRGYVMERGEPVSSEQFRTFIDNRVGEIVKRNTEASGF